MSPTSRGRRTKRKAPARSQRSEHDLLAARIVRDVFADLDEATGPIDGELSVSGLCGALWVLRPDETGREALGKAVVAHAARHRTGLALALLRCLVELGTPFQRSRAAEAAESLATKGVVAPGWTAELGPCVPAGGWVYGDVFGDQRSVLLAFERAGATHGLVVLVDETLGGIVRDAFVTPDPDTTLAELQPVAHAPTTWLREIALDEARGLLEAAFVATDRLDPEELDEDLVGHRALALARLRLLPAGKPPQVVSTAVVRGEREAIVARFLASASGQTLRDVPAAAALTRLIVDFGCDSDRGRPLRVGPGKTMELLDWLDEHPDLTEPMYDAVPDVLRAWVSWAGEQAGLPAAAMAELSAAVEELTEEFDDGDPELAAQVEAMLDGLDLDMMTPETLVEVLTRRAFAMPSFVAHIDGEPVELNPADPDDRGMLIREEHPEYHAALEDDLFDPTVDEVNPRLHLAVHEIVANQLWDDDPPEAWLAAQRLLANGFDRHDVLHALADVAVRFVHGALSGGEPVDHDAYGAALDELGAPASRRRAGPRPKQRAVRGRNSSTGP